MKYRLISLLLLAVAGAGEETGTEIRVELRPGAPSEKARLGYSSPRPLLIESTVPRFLFEIPELKAEDPLFFRVNLGETKGLPFYAALDRSPAGSFHDVLYLDRNRDLDLTNDGEPVAGKTRTLWSSGEKLVEFLDVRLDVPYTETGKEVREPYACVFYFVAKEGGSPRTVQVERDGWREGLLLLGDEPFLLALVDDDSDGQYTNSDSWVLRPAEEDLNALLTADATRSMLFPCWSADQKWTVEVRSTDAAGRHVTVDVSPARETEQAYFTRVASARQSPDERKLDIDPLRPKAKDNQTVDWIVGKDAAYAIEIASSPNVKKRVLLDFSAPGCQWCARMDAYTYRDREVVQLCKRFVCAKIQFAQGSADATKYSVDGTPTLIILEEDGTEVARRSGFVKPRNFAAFLKSALR